MFKKCLEKVMNSIASSSFSYRHHLSEKGVLALHDNFFWMLWYAWPYLKYFPDFCWHEPWIVSSNLKASDRPPCYTFIQSHFIAKNDLIMKKIRTLFMVMNGLFFLCYCKSVFLAKKWLSFTQLLSRIKENPPFMVVLALKNRNEIYVET